MSISWIKSKICKEKFDCRNLVKTGKIAYNKKEEGEVLCGLWL